MEISNENDCITCFIKLISNKFFFISINFEINCHTYYNSMQGGVGLTSDLSYANGLLPMVWDSSCKMIRRTAIGILIRPGGDDSPALVPPEV